MTALALAWLLSAPQAFGCPVKTPPYDTWDTARGYGSGEPVEAKREAMVDARRRMHTKMRDGYTAAQFDQMKKRVDTSWVEPLYDPVRRQACAIALLTRADDDTLRRLSAALDGGLAALAGSVAKKVGRARLRLVAPTWARGPDAGELGRLLSVRMHAPFVRHPKVRLVTRKPRFVLGGDLTADGGGCRLQPWLQRGDRRAVLDPVVFDPKAVGMRECAAPEVDTLSDATLGMHHGQRIGADGLRVSLSATLRHGMLCGGTPYALTVTTDRPADVRIYSVAEDGRVMGGWAHRVDGEWSATPAPAAVQLPGGTRYRVVAVAVAPGASFGGAPPMGCMTPRGVGLPPKRLPADAALAAITYGVWAPGDGECPRDPAAKRTHDQLLAAITGAPTCPDRR